METKFASPERDSIEKVRKDFNKFKDSPFIQEVLNALPNITMILNKHRQVVFSNSTVLEQLCLPEIDSLLGKRFGEILSCTNADREEAGCGTSEACKYCGGVNAILESINTKQQVTNECRIVSKGDDGDSASDFAVTAKIFFWEGEEFVILSLNDISNEKRRRSLEKIFFHDVINTAGTLSGMLNLMENIKDEEKIQKYIAMASNTSRSLIEDILSQREMLAAESGELMVTVKTLFSTEFLKSVIIQMMHHEVASGINIVLDEMSRAISFSTDEKLIRRIIINMLKNALEASPAKSTVALGCKVNKNILTFWVHNPVFMSREVQLQMFQRNFSTKGSGRGLGTYSIKLLGEKYLKGKVYFTSEETQGTKFFIDLPLK